MPEHIFHPVAVNPSPIANELAAVLQNPGYLMVIPAACNLENQLFAVTALP